MPDPENTSSAVEQHGYNKDELFELASSGDLDAIIGEKLANTQPHIVSAFLERIKTTDEQRVILRKFNATNASEILSEMEPEDAADVVSAMREPRAIKILEELDPDDAADVVNELEAPDRERLLEKVAPETAETVRNLITYDSDTAGGIMTPEVATVYEHMTVKEAIKQIRKMSHIVDTSYYIYVVDAENHLLGVLSMRDIVLAQAQTLIRDIMSTDLDGVCSVDMDQEAVALKMADLNYEVLPVVDANNTLLGIVTHDDVIEVIQEEATEDIHKMVGASADESVHDSIFLSVRGRGPWLLINLVTAFLAGGVIMIFEKSIQELTILAVFLPVIAQLGGNTGAQTLAIIIRSLALGEISYKDGSWITVKECFKGLSIGIVIGLLSAIIAFVLSRDIRIAGVVFLAMLLTIIFAAVAGALIPLLLKRFNLDPAQSSSIFLTASVDIVGFAIFLGLGHWMLL